MSYLREHPEVKVIDRLDGIRTLQNRGTMLLPLQGDGIAAVQVRERTPCAAAGACVGSTSLPCRYLRVRHVHVHT
jgi:hypothetical protein